MSKPDRVISMISIAAKGRNLVSGEFAVEKAVNEKGYHNPLRLSKATSGNDAGLIGAALLLKDKVNG